MRARRGIAQPPARRVGQRQLFAEQLLRQRRQEAPRPRFCTTAAPIALTTSRGVARRRAPGRPGRRSRTGSSSSGSRAAVDAAHDEVDLFQAFERLQVDALARDPQIAPLDEQEAEIAREIGVREIVLVMWPGRQQRDAGVVASGVAVSAALQRLEVGARRTAFAA